MKIMIVEDEVNYSDTLEMIVDELGYETVGVADHGAIAQDLFKKKKPDLVLMDINIKGDLTGIDLARTFQVKRSVPIIFITSYEDESTFIQAKHTGPFAYLTKPFDPTQLQRNIELALQYAHADGQRVFENQSEVVLASTCFFVKERNKLVKVPVRDILWIEVQDKYCTLHTKSKKFALRKSLKELASELDPQTFVQTHRSFVVNALEIDDIDLNLYSLKIHGADIPLGRSYKEELLQRLQML